MKKSVKKAVKKPAKKKKLSDQPELNIGLVGH